jgi:ATP-dependent helicase/nuclease subunit A
MSVLTPEQQLCVSLRNVSVGISAGAGCGKTRVLTERFLRELEEALTGPGAQSSQSQPNGWEQASNILNQLVAITFTQRAARELVHRVRQTCEQRLGRRDSAWKLWLNLWRILDFARIGTIHSFCSTVLRRFPVEAELDPAFQVLDEAASQGLIYQVTETLLQEKLASLEPQTMDLAFALGLERLTDAIVSLVWNRTKWHPTGFAEISAKTLAKIWKNRILDTCKQYLAQFLESDELRQLCEIAQKHQPSSELLQRRCKEILAVTATLNALAQLPEPSQRGEFLQSLTQLRESARIDKAPRDVGWSEDIRANFCTAADVVRQKCDQLLGLVTTDTESLTAAAELMTNLLRLADEAAKRYESIKKEQSALDFSDLVTRAAELFRIPRESLRHFAEEIHLLLVDEFQDTDREQEELIRGICGAELTAGKLFFVGDYKQSIYRFRRADPEVFRKLRSTLPAEGQLALTQNFRSQPGILHFVNALFHRVLGPEYEPLNASRPALGDNPLVEFLWALESDGQEGQKENQGQTKGVGRQSKRGDLRALEADFIARRLRWMFDTGEKLVAEKDHGGGQPTLRAARPGDVVILFRALSDIDLYEKALREWGIDYYLVGGRAFYAQQEIYDLCNLLRAIADPADALSLAGVLRSSFFGLKDESLWWLSKTPGGLVNGFYGSRLPEELEPEQRKAVERARDILLALRELKDRVPLPELITQALNWTGYDALLLTEFLGERKLANLRKLIELAREFDRVDFLGLEGFIARLAEFVAFQPAEPMAPLIWESADVVRLMTIHQAKGLEFPVVIVADLSRSARGPHAVVRFSEECGPFLCTDVLPDALRRALAAPEDQKDLQELYRLFYVACTRAADYLILSAGLSSLEKPTGPWLEHLANYFCLRTGQYRSQLPKGWPEPKVKVTIHLPEPQLPEKPRQKTLSPEEILSNLQTGTAAPRSSEDILRYLPPIPVDRAGQRELSFSVLRGWEVEWAVPKGRDVSPLAQIGSLRQEGREEEEESPAGSPWIDLSRWLATADEAGPGAVTGSFVHEVLRYLDFSRPQTVPQWLTAVAIRYDELPESMESLQEMIERFLNSPRGQEIARAEKLLREAEFLFSWPEPIAGRELPYFRGFFDCLYRDRARGWVLLDYKTNRISEKQVPAAAEEYRLQLELYGLAAQEILGEPPRELVLYFLRPGQEWVMAWDETAASQARERIGALLRSIMNDGLGGLR